MTDIDPLDIDEGIERDRYGRPKIIQLNAAGEPTEKTIAYTRASTFAKALDDGAGLIAWKLRHAAVGIAQRPDLAQMAAALGRNPDDFTKAKKAELDGIIETAHDASFGNAKANYGTAVHALTEPGNDGVALDPLAADVDSFKAACTALDLVVVDSEEFVVQDLVKVAGTYDHRILTARDLKLGGEVIVPAGTMMIADKKTGSLHISQNAIQLAVYAHSKAYDRATGARSDLEVSTEWALIAHIPARKGITEFYLVDIEAGWKVGAYLAQQVREFTSGPNERKLATKFAAEGADPADPKSGIVASEDVPAWKRAEPAEKLEPAAELAETDLAPVIEAARADVEVIAAVTAVEPDPVAEPEVAAVESVEPPPADDIGAAAALLSAQLGAVDEVMQAIDKAVEAYEFAALWRHHKDAWRPEHTERVKVRQAELSVAA